MGAARIETGTDPAGRPLLRLGGRLDAAGVGDVWGAALGWAASTAGDRVVDASEVAYCNGAGAGLLLALRERSAEAGGVLEFVGLADATTRLLERIESTAEAPDHEDQSELGPIQALGRASLELARDVREQIAFVGELASMLGRAALQPSRVRWRDTFRIAERAGIGALPIVGIVGFLLGLILSFQSAIPMRRFGAEIFVADLLGLAMFRELAPLMTAILLTARSGSAFAAEIGTMKINEELDALSTMGLEPVRFLAVPRVLAVILVVPVLTMWMNVTGLAGGAVVFRSLEFPLVTYVTRVTEFSGPVDLLGGLGKSFALGLIVAAVGVQRGLRAGNGAGAVGQATTSSVVSGIVLIAIAEGLFAVMFYVMGW